MSDAIILIPGVKGNHLVDVNTPSFQPVWRDERFHFTDLDSLELTNMFEGERYDEKIDSIINRGQIEFLAYNEFMDDLELPGEELDQDDPKKVAKIPRFIFGYDWRRSNRENGRRLNEYIEMIKKKSQASSNPNKIKKFNIVTHSMGNHVARFYIKDFGFNRIHKVVFVAPPFLGSLVVVEGLVIGQGRTGSIKKKTREVARTFPGALELIPRYKNAATFKNGEEVDFFNKDHWQSGIIAPLSEIGTSKQIRRTKIFAKNLEIAKKDLGELDQWIDGLSEEEKDRILVIVRDECNTMQALNVDKDDKNTVEFKDALCTDSGDAVVTNASSCIYHDKILTLALENNIRINDREHPFVMNEERVQDLVGWFFGSDPFKFDIPGRSVKRVTGLTAKTKDGFTHWVPEKEDAD
jgi:hypothetical protein